MPGNTRVKPSAAPLKPISKIVVLVHPLWSLVNNLKLDKKDSPHKLQDPYSRKKVQFLLGLWGNEIKKAASSPSDVVVLVRFPDYSTRKYASQRMRLLNWAEAKVSRLEEFARRVLGKRLVSMRSADPRATTFRRALQENGFRFAKKWSGKLFGEYLTRCVERQRIFLEWSALTPSQLREGRKNIELMRKLIPRVHLESVPQLSVLPLYPRPHETNGLSLGSMHEDPRKRLRNVRRYLRRNPSH